MDLKFLTSMALTGGSWVIYLLLLCSVAALAVIVERAILLRREEAALDGLETDLLRGLDASDWEAVEKTLGRHAGAAARILQAGLAQSRQGASNCNEVGS